MLKPGTITEQYQDDLANPAIFFAQDIPLLVRGP